MSIARLATVSVAALGVLSALAGLARPAMAQTPETGFKEKIEVFEVLLDVLATDRKGDVVRGLTSEDFVVEEEGRPVELTGVSFYTTRYGAEAPVDSQAAEIPASRYLILFFHDVLRFNTPGNRLLQQQLEAGRQSQQWVRDEMMPSDWVAVASYDVKLVVHQDFTQDRDDLVAAISRAALGKDEDVPTPSRRRRDLATAREVPSMAPHLPHPLELPKETTRIYDGLRLLAEATGHLVGRKNLLLFTIGFGDTDRGGPFARPDPRYYPALEQALNAHNVAVYPIDLTRPEIEHVQSSFLNQLAADSGGRYYESFVSFITPLRQVSDENAGYYVLSYRAERPAGESGYRQVKVKSKNRKVRLRARRGYRYGG